MKQGQGLEMQVGESLEKGFSKQTIQVASFKNEGYVQLAQKLNCSQTEISSFICSYL